MTNLTIQFFVLLRRLNRQSLGRSQRVNTVNWLTLCEKGFIIAACCFFLPSLSKVSVTLQNNLLTCPISVYFKVWFLYHRQQIQSILFCHRRHRHHYYHYYTTIIIIIIIVIIFIITIWRAILRLSSLLFLLLVSFFLTRGYAKHRSGLLWWVAKFLACSLAHHDVSNRNVVAVS